MKNGSFTGEMSRKYNMKFWLTSERAGQIILITKGNDMKKGMRIAAAVMAAAFSMTAVSYTHLDVYKRQWLFIRIVTPSFS